MRSPSLAFIVYIYWKIEMKSTNGDDNDIRRELALLQSLKLRSQSRASIRARVCINWDWKHSMELRLWRGSWDFFYFILHTALSRCCRPDPDDGDERWSKITSDGKRQLNELIKMQWLSEAGREKQKKESEKFLKRLSESIRGGKRVNWNKCGWMCGFYC